MAGATWPALRAICSLAARSKGGTNPRVEKSPRRATKIADRRDGEASRPRRPPRLPRRRGCDIDPAALAEYGGHRRAAEIEVSRDLAARPRYRCARGSAGCRAISALSSSSRPFVGSARSSLVNGSTVTTIPGAIGAHGRLFRGPELNANSAAPMIAATTKMTAKSSRREDRRCANGGAIDRRGRYDQAIAALRYGFDHLRHCRACHRTPCAAAKSPGSGSRPRQIPCPRRDQSGWRATTRRPGVASAHSTSMTGCNAVSPAGPLTRLRFGSTIWSPILNERSGSGSCVHSRLYRPVRLLRSDRNDA